MVIRLSSDMETALVQESQLRGITPEQLVTDSLENLFLQAPPVASAVEASLFDSLSGYIGTVEGTREALSKHCGQHFTEELVANREEGHL
jgi:hypothetical protein